MKKIFKYTALIVIVAAISLLSLTALVGCEKPKEGAFDREIVFASSKDNGEDKSSIIMGIPVDVALQCEAVFRPDGTCTVKVLLNKGFGPLLTFLLDATDMLDDLDVVGLVDQWIKDYLPGLDMRDLEGSFNIIKGALNLEIYGFDFTDPDIIAIQESLIETGTLGDNFVIPEGFGLEYNGNYYVEQITSPYNDEVYTVINMDNVNVKGEPFMRFLLTEDAELGLRIDFNISMVNANIVVFEVR